MSQNAYEDLINEDLTKELQDLEATFQDGAPTLDFDYEVSDFFHGNLLKVRSAVSEQSFRRFARLESNGARVAFVLRHPEARELPVEVDNCEGKSSIKASAIKKLGNQAFGVDHFEPAINEYNRAVLLAPKEEVGVILANRSAAFYHLERYGLALRDCEEALKVGYPEELLYKLEERRARCLLGLKCHANAVLAFKAAIQALDRARLPTEKKLKLQADMRVMIALMEKGMQLDAAKYDKLVEAENKRLKERDAAPKIKDCNPVYPACSGAVEIRDEGGEIGRHAVATRDIKPGEILAVERPHCFSLLPERRLTHCHGCSARIGAPYPASCYVCSSIAYCCPRCRDQDEAAHRVECPILGPLWCSRASVTCALALRAVLQRPYEQLVQLRRDGLGIKADKTKPYHGGDYRTFWNLVTHEDERDPEDLFHRAYMAAWLLRVLKMSSYFPNSAKTPDAAEVELSEGELLVADAILHHIQLLQFNTHEVSEFVRPKKKADLSQGRNLFVGGGVYPTVALFNHSCNPGVVRYFVGNTVVVRAIRTIASGSEIAENYGPIFTEEEENERKRKLRLQYWFDCKCEACENHWPLLQNINPNILRFKCETGPSCGNILLVDVNTSEFMIRCPKCGESTNIFKGLKAMQDTDGLYKTATKYSQAGNHMEALKAYLEILKILDETLALPIKDYHLCQQGVRECVLALGNSSLV